jgi:hypothetical protein
MNTEATESGKQRRQRQVTETRRELFARLENPEISLEEAAIPIPACCPHIARREDNDAFISKT